MYEVGKWPKLYNVWVINAKLIHGDKYTYLPYIESGYKGVRHKVKIICNTHGELLVWPSSHTKGSVCYKCYKLKRNMSTEEFIKKAKLKHGEIYNYDKTIYTHSMHKVIITCNKHGDFAQTANGHLNGNGCIKCSYDKFRTNSEDYITKARLLHGDKYNYDNINYKQSFVKINIVCPAHGLFKQRPVDHLTSGCNKCAADARSKKFLKNTEWFVKKAKVVHGERFDYSKSNYTGYDGNINIICKTHGLFTTTVRLHLKGVNCIKCTWDSFKSNTSQFITKSKAVHGDKFSYDKVVYGKAIDKVIITCLTHGDFKQVASDHLSGSGCPICNESKGEIAVKRFLIDNHIEYKREYSFPNSKYRYDFYLPKLNILVEYHGIQHYKPISYFGGIEKHKTQLINDHVKIKLAKTHGVNLITIRYDINDIHDYMLFKISRYYKYRVDNKFYRNLLSLCRGLKMPLDSRRDDVKQYLTYKKC